MRFAWPRVIMSGSDSAEGSLAREAVGELVRGLWRALRWPLAMVGALAWLLIAWLLYLLVSMLLIGAHHSTRNTDVGIVLGAGVTDGKPSAPFLARIDYAVKVYKAGRVRRLLFSGGRVLGQREESLVARDRAIAMGVPPQDILVDDKSWNTRVNLAESRKVMAANGAKTALVITEPLHMMRSLRMAHDLGIDAEGEPPPQTFYQDWASWRRFVRSELILYHIYLWTGR